MAQQGENRPPADSSPSMFKSDVSGLSLKASKSLIVQLQVLVRTSQIHEITNIALDRPVAGMMRALEAIFESEGEFSIIMRGEYLYLDETRIRYDIEDMASYEYLVDYLKEKRIGGLSFSGPVRPEDLKRFAYCINELDPSEEEPNEALNKKLAAAGVRGIEAEEVMDREEIQPKTLTDQRRMAKKTYFQAVSVTKGIMNTIKSDQPTHLKKVKRVVQKIVDIILDEESSLMGLTTIKDFDEYTYNHSVNVSILAITIGQKLGLDKNMLTKIGIAALLHDIGKIEIPIEILNKPESFTDDDWKIVHLHPQNGVKAIAKIRGLNEMAASSIVVAFEHHIYYDMSGYPATRTRRLPNFFSRIVSLADQYDSMTSARVYSRIPYQPDKALSLMMERSGVQLDPLLFKIFANIVGIHPIGTLVMLDSRELGLVFESNPNPDRIDRPKVMLITDSSGRRIQGATVDLSERDESGSYRRTIIKSLDPKKYNIDLAEYFL